MTPLLPLLMGAALAQDPVDAGLGILITQDGLANVNTLATSLPLDPLVVDDTSVRECYGLLCWTCLCPGLADPALLAFAPCNSARPCSALLCSALLCPALLPSSALLFLHSVVLLVSPRRKGYSYR